jgi:hypothetical protein
MYATRYMRWTWPILVFTSIFVLVKINHADAQPATPATLSGAFTLDKLLDLILKSLALIAGGVWFVYHPVSGYLTVNLALELRIDRNSEADRENIAVQITMKKGDQGKLDLYDVKVRLRTVHDIVADLPSSVTFGSDV